MIQAIIKGKPCNTINDFYSLTVPKIKYSYCNKPIHTIGDFYKEFLIDSNRLPQKNVVEAWHKLLVWYIDQPNAPLFIRKYEAGKNEGEWDNRRGCVVQFQDGFEIVYASNFLAHDIFLMAYHGFVPSKTDFMKSIKKRELRITSGTNIERALRLYPSANKGLSYCYLAHIMDVNGRYLRDDGSYKELSKSEVDWIFPRGVPSEWENSPDKIWHISRKLSDSEKEIAKAHCLRFLDPMNYYLTPLTKHCVHTIPGFKKNIGEFSCLTYYIQQQYKGIFADNYKQLVERGRFLEQKPKGYTGSETINLEYSVDTVKSNELDETVSVIPRIENPVTPSVKFSHSVPNEANDFIDELGDFMRNKSGLSERSVRIYLGRIKKLLEHGYSVDDICGAIESLIKSHGVGGQNYDSKDSGNTQAALGQIRKMIKYPYICYNLGYQSFCYSDEHLTGYCIDGDTITISKSRGFVPLGDITKKISKKDKIALIELLEEADKNFLFANSSTCIRYIHGMNSSYDYGYGRNRGINCNNLFKVNTLLAVNLNKKYNELIDKLTK